MSRANNARRRRAKKDPASLGQSSSSGLPLTRLPTLDSVITTNHTFRWTGTLLASTTYNVTATDLNRILGAVVDSTHIVPLIGSWRIRKVRYYSMDSSNGILVGPMVRWSDSSGSLTEETKASVRAPVGAGSASPSMSVLTPPRDTLLASWHRNSASGNILDLVVLGDNITFCLDLTLEFTWVNQESTASTAVTATNTSAGINMREICSTQLIPVGMLAYAP